MRDLPYALRVLRNNPGFAAAAVLTLALGIGVNATIFSLFDAVALRPIPLGGTTQAVSVYQQIHDTVSSREIHGSTDLLSYPEFARYRDESQVFTGAAAYVPEFSALIGSDPHPVRGQLTTCNYFDVVGIRPAIGRGFAASNARATVRARRWCSAMRCGGTTSRRTRASLERWFGSTASR